jgi:hypothetical protein
MMLRIDIHHWFAMAAILNSKWPPKYKNPPIWAKLYLGYHGNGRHFEFFQPSKAARHYGGYSYKV